MSGFTKNNVKGSNCNEMLPNDDGSLNVNAVIVDEHEGGKQKEVKSVFGEVSSVAVGATVDVVTFIIPIGWEFFLQRVEYSGNNIGTFELYVDGGIIGRERTWFNGPLSDAFEFSSDLKSGLQLNAGQQLTMKVNNFRPSLGDFEGRIHGVLQEV